MDVHLAKDRTRIRSHLAREIIAELLGTFILTFLGTSSIAQFVLSHGENSNPTAIYCAWGLGVMVAIYSAYGISGAHLNPAITLGLTSLGRVHLRKVPLYFLSQTLGAFLGAALTYIVYIDALNEFDGGTRSMIGVNGTAGIFCTFPQKWLSTGGGVLDQTVGTAFLQLGVLAITDKRNGGVPAGLQPLLIGLLVTVIQMALVYNCMACINPARDLGPRIFVAIAGWGTEVFSFRKYNWFWVPIVGPLLGGVLGAQGYYWLIERHHPPHYGIDADIAANGMASVMKCKSNEILEYHFTSTDELVACSNDIKTRSTDVQAFEKNRL